MVLESGYEVFIAYLEGHEEEIEQQRDFVLEIRDRRDFSLKVVRAKVARSLAEMPSGEKLWVRTYDERELPEPWAIQILEELDEDEVRPLRADVARGDLPKRDQLYGR